MASYAKLPHELRDQLGLIEPSQDGILKYYPCAVTLRNGTLLDRVYVVDFAPYIKM